MTISETASTVMHSSYITFEKNQNIDEYTEEYIVNSIEECDLLLEEALCKLSDVIESLSRDSFKEEKDRMSVTDATALLSHRNAFVRELSEARDYLIAELVGHRKYINEMSKEADIMQEIF
ncbi:hypothetical protein ASJ81_04895 [Methanosarcina spelaei]|jgi:hypothetical protein|uniref:Uncharacterized protein n=1 Tax=Methanosarcina spelaei TaxID=1036679 RepID=A0A2A2HUG4_9EURY|nr:hypothetical protein [Methanosarcina spelaei]PAV12930.1 hypothetical protein ASJ81_04895 [Methanosarcina spelaei]